MEIFKKYKALIIAVLVIMAGVLFFFYRMYHNDVAALTNFSASYEKYNAAMAHYSAAINGSNPKSTLATPDLEYKADQAVVELKAKAAVRISSLIKNDGELMSTELDIADLSAKELDTLNAYKKALRDKNNADAGRLAKEYADLLNNRKSAYTHFLELAGTAN